MPVSEEEHLILSNVKTDIQDIDQCLDATTLIPELWSQGILSEENVMEIHSHREYGYEQELQRLLEIYETNATDLKPLADTLRSLGGFSDLARRLWPIDSDDKHPINIKKKLNTCWWGCRFCCEGCLMCIFWPFCRKRRSPKGPANHTRGRQPTTTKRPSYSEERPVVVALGGHGVSDTFEYWPFYDHYIEEGFVRGLRFNYKSQSLTTERWGHSANTLNDGTIIIMGGCDNSHNFLCSTDILDPESGDWKSGPNMTIGRSQAVSGLLHGRTLIFGGLGEMSCEYLDSEEHKWVQTNSMNKKRWGAAAVSFGDGIYILGGRLGGPTVTKNVEMFTPGGSYPWIVSKPLPTARTLLSGCAMDESSMLICGGMDARGRNLDDCLLFDIREGLWHEAGTLIQKCSEHQFVKFGENFLAMGGVGVGYTPMSLVQDFEPRMMVWNESLDTLDMPRHTFAATVVCPVLLNKRREVCERSSAKLETVV